LIKNEIVDIFQKPVEREDFEGKARLIENYRPDDGDGLSIWYVEFLNEPGEFYLRTIYKEVD
jgi:hypothetical protein